jgi:class 3 adenylate cyclase/tetratricopeptide (TPR) repeat protein
VVTVLFCDLVGFTARSDRADPEDVRAILQPFHSLARAEIERHGGTLDKFIGDAAMGVFGSPVAHEDDPERAVRVALRLLDGIRILNERHTGEPLAVRIGVNTGEALVTPADGVREGLNVAGDVVNTASRLQTAAPVGGILVGESTYRATSQAVEYEELEPVIAKGKTEPLRVWRAVAVRPLATITERGAATPFVGRHLERSLLEQAFLRALTQKSVQLVTIVGEPGVGKSRLVAEFGASLSRLAPEATVQWRRGRCLPYGDGITFWALGEIVKGQAGVFDSDSAPDRDKKLTELLAGLVAESSERAWLHVRLAPLVGGDAGTPVEREEAFAAWLQFIEAVGRVHPLVAVLEDVHWADPAMVAFIEHLAEHATASPLLVIATARPELYDRYPTWGAGMRNAAVVSLPPLSEDETTTLISSLLHAASLSPDTQELLLERSGGNPLYAEEFTRTLRDRGLVDETGRLTKELGALEFPQSVQALIAARLDTLAPERKAELQDASVIGRVFWSGAVASLADADETKVKEHLHELSRRELVRPVPSSSLRSQSEYAFLHALVRDIAYAQIPRAVRSAKHRLAAAWIEGIAGERLGDLGEILAHHATSALELARAAGQTEGLLDLEASAARYLRLAAGRAMSLDVAKAEALLLRALELTPTGHPDRARVQASLAEAAFHAGRFEDAQQRYQEAIAGFRAKGQLGEAADAMVRQSVVLEYRGETTVGRALLSEAVELLGQLPPGPELARALATGAGAALVAGRYQEVVVQADRAIQLSEQVGESVAAARARAFRGYARAIQGDRGGVDEQRKALHSLRALGVGRAAAVVYNNLGSCLAHIEGPQAALEAFREGVAFAETRGLREAALAIRDSMLTVLFEVGEWDEVLRLGSEVVEEAKRQGSGHDEAFANADRAAVLAHRQGAGARAFCESVLQQARPLEDPPLVMWAMIGAAVARLAAADLSGAAGLVGEALELTRDDVVVRAGELPHLVRLSIGAGDLGLAERALEGTDALGLERYRLTLLSARAALTEARQEPAGALAMYEDAAAAWARWGHVLEGAYALFGAGRCLAGLGRLKEARARFEAAAAAFARLGAEPALAEVRSAMGQDPLNPGPA